VPNDDDAETLRSKTKAPVTQYNLIAAEILLTLSWLSRSKWDDGKCLSVDANLCEAMFLIVLARVEIMGESLFFAWSNNGQKWIVLRSNGKKKRNNYFILKKRLMIIDDDDEKNFVLYEW
jgi:hypothetical protein